MNIEYTNMAPLTCFVELDAFLRFARWCGPVTVPSQDCKITESQ